jgi:hypothetical protein
MWDQIAAAYLAALMLFSAWSKITDMPAFRKALRDYPYISGNNLRRISRSVPASETIIACCLLAPAAAAHRTGVLLAFLLLTAVTALVGLRVWRGDKSFHCGCSGDFGHGQSGYRLLARNVVLLSIASALVYARGAERIELPALLSGVGLLCSVEFVAAAWRARKAIVEWKAIG